MRPLHVDGGGNALDPSTQPNRITALDVLRGFAVMGILLVNVTGFSGVVAGAHGESALSIDRAAEWLIANGARGVFYPLFSMLFGIGFALQMARIDENGGARVWRYGRRLMVLLGFGLLHRLLDPSEVLVPYALCGSLLLLVRRVPSKAVLVTALVVFPLPYLHTAITASRSVPQTVAADDARADFFAWNPYRSAEGVEVHSEGDLTRVVTYNVRFAVNQLRPSLVSYLWLSVPFPLMLIGMVMGRSNILARIDENLTAIRWACWLGFGGWAVGRFAASTLFGLAGADGWNPWIALPAEMTFVLGGYALTFGYSAGVLLLTRQESWERVSRPLQAIGRLALTHYLTQTVICTTLFYQYGFGLFGDVGPAQALGIAVIIFLAQLAFSAIWIQRYRFGPLEWLWRSATYWRFLPNTGRA